jgi:uncharacterized protein (DUF1697 family)
MVLIALLRGINVGGRNRLPMGELRRLMETLGHGNVRTHIQSGNVVFETDISDREQIAGVLSDAIEKAHGLSVPVVIRDVDELTAALARHPFRADEPDGSRLAVSFMATAPGQEAVASLEADRFLPDRFAVDGTDLYLHFPNGMGTSKMLPTYFDRRLGRPGTVRNLNTIEKLITLATAS